MSNLFHQPAYLRSYHKRESRPEGSPSGSPTSIQANGNLSQGSPNQSYGRPPSLTGRRNTQQTAGQLRTSLKKTPSNQEIWTNQQAMSRRKASMQNFPPAPQ